MIVQFNQDVAPMKTLATATEFHIASALRPLRAGGVHSALGKAADD